jgi:pimeloyl-ACP methyl ester carboxylesterase
LVFNHAGFLNPEPTASKPLRFTDLPKEIKEQILAAVAEESNGPLEPPFDKLPLAAQQARQWMRAQPSWMAANNSSFGPDEVAAIKADRQRNRQPLGDKPLIVLTRDEAATGERAADREESRKRNQADLAKLSRQGKQVIVKGTGHHVQIDQPAAVVDAIREVIGAVGQ